MKLRLLVGVLVTFRIALLLVYEDSMQGFRDYLHCWAEGADGHKKFWWARILSCFWCTALWTSFPVTLVILSPYWIVLLPFAISGGAILLFHASGIMRVLRK